MKEDEKPKEIIYAKSRLFELVQLPQPDGRLFEVARRAPGVRTIVADDKQRRVLLTKEFRREIKGYDWRLPGGKVFDSLEEYEAFRNSGKDIMPTALSKAKSEVAEEAGMDIDNLSFYKKSALGATVEWDLYVFATTTWRRHPLGQQLKEDEPTDIVGVEWQDVKSLEKMILEGAMQEERVALILLQWLYQQAWFSR
ncbi:MAG TPA: NUDIX hydrolase [Candidatus Saccharimonadales bacterium]|nr:NUDIX hydrolase [Candidatus Saccharimonadales bacterium]